MGKVNIGIVGGGVIGLSAAWRLAEDGHSVTLWDRQEVGRGTSWLAAGMLAPAAEIGFSEMALFEWSLESLDLWDRFASDLEAASGMSIDFRTEGSLIVAPDQDTLAYVDRLAEFQAQQGVAVNKLNEEQAQEIEPWLSPGLAGVMHVPRDYQVDNRRLLPALRKAAKSAGVVILENRLARLGSRGTQPVIQADSENTVLDVVLLTTGVWTETIGDAAGMLPSVRPVKGQMIQLQATPQFGLKHVVRGPEAYVVPKSDGRVLVGATSEEVGLDETTTAGAIQELLEGARDIVPGIAELPITDMWAGFRPAALDNAPVVGWLEPPGVAVATGHYRNGILLAPITAKTIVSMVNDQETPALVDAFKPSRFRVTPPNA